jgi:hypothetical protein
MFHRPEDFGSIFFYGEFSFNGRTERLRPRAEDGPGGLLPVDLL